MQRHLPVRPPVRQDVLCVSDGDVLLAHRLGHDARQRAQPGGPALHVVRAPLAGRATTPIAARLFDTHTYAEQALPILGSSAGLACCACPARRRRVAPQSVAAVALSCGPRGAAAARRAILPAYGAGPYLPAIMLERPVYVREISDGLYTAFTYLLYKARRALCCAAPGCLSRGSPAARA